MYDDHYYPTDVSSWYGDVRPSSRDVIHLLGHLDLRVSGVRRQLIEVRQRALAAEERENAA